MSYPHRIRVVEVGPRDGLQNEASMVSVDTKIALIEALADAGLTSIEAGSFVSPIWVPQMAGTPEVLAQLRRRPGVRYPVLVPNVKGLERAMAQNVEEIAIFGAASETFSRTNINCSIEESFARFEPVVAQALAAGLKVRGYVSCALGCPYEGEVDPAAVARVAARLDAMGCYEVSIADTIGTGTPLKAARLIERIVSDIPLDRIAIHFHDTYGQALANILACIGLGVSVVDSAIAGLGGCPYARGATGNVATEDLVYMLDGMEIETGLDLGRLCDIGWTISEALGRPNASRVSRARGK